MEGLHTAANAFTRQKSTLERALGYIILTHNNSVGYCCEPGKLTELSQLAPESLVLEASQAELSLQLIEELPPNVVGSVDSSMNAHIQSPDFREAPKKLTILRTPMSILSNKRFQTFSGARRSLAVSL